jgi:hypothetical protein
MRHRRSVWWVVALVVLGLGTAGCASRTVWAETASPAEVEPIAGTGVSRVTLTGDAVRAVGIQTEPVRGDGSAARPLALSVIPIAALIYDPQGAPWTYIEMAPRTFIRKAVVIERITDGTVYLRSGPPIGTPVVTVGASELLGAEYGVGQE